MRLRSFILKIKHVGGYWVVPSRLLWQEINDDKIAYILKLNLKVATNM